eukprot:13649940-Alexandrium_andersonii.AAC.1
MRRSRRGRLQLSGTTRGDVSAEQQQYAVDHRRAARRRPGAAGARSRRRADRSARHTALRWWLTLRLSLIHI